MPGSAESERLWEQLLLIIEEERAIPVVGRGLLTLSDRGRQVMLYDQLAARLAEHLHLPGPKTADDDPLTLNGVACDYLESGGELEDIYSAVKSILPDDEDLPIPEPLLKLAEIRPLKLFISTTFDSLLERAINQVRFGGERKTKVFAYSPQENNDIDNPITDLRRPTVFHLLGRLTAVPYYYAVTDEDVLEFIHSLQSETRRPPLLFDAVTRHELLIVGCCFSNWLARFFVRIAKPERLSAARGKTDVLVDDAVYQDPRLVLFLQHFSARTKVFPLGAVDFVDELHSRWTAQHPHTESVGVTPQREKPGDLGMEPGSVFLSYASEDLSVVEGIKDELSRAGIDVWFDKEKLKGGDRFQAKITRNIERCSFFVPVISRHTLTLQKRFFRVEWDIAQRVAVTAPPQLPFIVPVNVDDTSPDDQALPEKFRDLHWQGLPGGRATPDFVEHMRGLFRTYQRSIASGN